MAAQAGLNRGAARVRSTPASPYWQACPEAQQPHSCAQAKSVHHLNGNRFVRKLPDKRPPGAFLSRCRQARHSGMGEL